MTIVNSVKRTDKKGNVPARVMTGPEGPRGGREAGDPLKNYYRQLRKWHKNSSHFPQCRLLNACPVNFFRREGLQQNHVAVR
jgi:hypothetical protein